MDYFKLLFVFHLNVFPYLFTGRLDMNSEARCVDATGALTFAAALLALKNLMLTVGRLPGVFAFEDDMNAVA